MDTGKHLTYNAFMMIQTYPLPKLHKLPVTMPEDGAISFMLEEGIPTFQAAKQVTERIYYLLDKQRTEGLSPSENNELDRYAEIDDYLSHLNRVVRNMLQTQDQ